MMRTSEQRLNELSAVFKRRYYAQIRKLFTDEVFSAYTKNPMGPHDDRTARVVHAFGNADVAGKEVVMSLGANGPWGIGRVSVGEAGNLSPLPDTFNSYHDALRRIFALRREAFFATFEINDPASENEGAAR